MILFSCIHLLFIFRKQLGGKLGDSLQNDLGVNTVGDLLQFSEQKLQERYGFNTGYAEHQNLKQQAMFSPYLLFMFY